jgi:threonine dehydratase
MPRHPSRALMPTFADIERARERIRDSIYESPCAYSETFSQMCGCKTFFKLENLQMAGSFKERGALNKILTLSESDRRRGVVTASAGNHAQGVAYHATRLGLAATVVMPVGTPLMKVQSSRRYGAEVLLHGGNYDEAWERALALASAMGRVLVHPFDDEAVIAGQGTIGLELLEQNPYLEVVVVPVGGGGLAAGVSMALKETNPRIKVIGVQAKAVASAQASLKAGAPVGVPAAMTLADGLAVRRVGEITFPILARYLDDLQVVTEEEIANAILLLLEREKTVVEGAGATPLAAVLGAAETLDTHRDALSDHQSRMLVDVVRRQSSRLERLLADLLDVDRLTRGLVVPQRTPTAILELVRRVVLGQDHDSHSFTVDGDELVLELDAPKVERIVDNLATYAVSIVPYVLSGG